MYKTFDLEQYCDRKSFYGKCYVEETENCFALYSYFTRVMEYNKNTGEVVRLWKGYSATTMRHVNAFLNFLGIDNGGKKYWDSLSGKY